MLGLSQSFLETRPIKVLVVPIGDNSLFDEQFSIISRLKTIPMYDLARPSNWKKSALKHLNWSGGNLHFDYLRYDRVPHGAGDLDNFQSSKRILMIVGLVNYPELGETVNKIEEDLDYYSRRHTGIILRRVFIFNFLFDCGIPPNWSPKDPASTVIFPPEGLCDDGGASRVEVHLHEVMASAGTMIVVSLESQLQQLEDYRQKGVLPPAPWLSTRFDDLETAVASEGSSYSNQRIKNVIKKKPQGRLRKWMGDVSLQVCSPLDAIEHFSQAISECRQTGDDMWLAGSLEGYVTSLILLLKLGFILDEVIPKDMKTVSLVDPDGHEIPEAVRVVKISEDKLTEALLLYGKHVALAGLEVDCAIRAARMHADLPPRYIDTEKILSYLYRSIAVQGLTSLQQVEVALEASALCSRVHLSNGSGSANQNAVGSNIYNNMMRKAAFFSFLATLIAVEAENYDMARELIKACCVSYGININMEERACRVVRRLDTNYESDDDDENGSSKANFVAVKPEKSWISIRKVLFAVFAKISKDCEDDNSLSMSIAGLLRVFGDLETKYDTVVRYLNPILEALEKNNSSIGNNLGINYGLNTMETSNNSLLTTNNMSNLSNGAVVGAKSTLNVQSISGINSTSEDSVVNEVSMQSAIFHGSNGSSSFSSTVTGSTMTKELLFSPVTSSFRVAPSGGTFRSKSVLGLSVKGEMRESMSERGSIASIVQGGRESVVGLVNSTLGASKRSMSVFGEYNLNLLNNNTANTPPTPTLSNTGNMGNSGSNGNDKVLPANNANNSNNNTNSNSNTNNNTNETEGSIYNSYFGSVDTTSNANGNQGAAGANGAVIVNNSADANAYSQFFGVRTNSILNIPSINKMLLLPESGNSGGNNSSNRLRGAAKDRGMSPMSSNQKRGSYVEESSFNQNLTAKTRLISNKIMNTFQNKQIISNFNNALKDTIRKGNHFVQSNIANAGIISTVNSSAITSANNSNNNNNNSNSNNANTSGYLTQISFEDLVFSITQSLEKNSVSFDSQDETFQFLSLCLRQVTPGTKLEFPCRVTSLRVKKNSFIERPVKVGFKAVEKIKDFILNEVNVDKENDVANSGNTSAGSNVNSVLFYDPFNRSNSSKSSKGDADTIVLGQGQVGRVFVVLSNPLSVPLQFDSVSLIVESEYCLKCSLKGKKQHVDRESESENETWRESSASTGNSNHNNNNHRREKCNCTQSVPATVIVPSSSQYEVELLFIGNSPGKFRISGVHFRIRNGSMIVRIDDKGQPCSNRSEVSSPWQYSRKATSYKKTLTSSNTIAGKSTENLLNAVGVASSSIATNTFFVTAFAPTYDAALLWNDMNGFGRCCSELFSINNSNINVNNNSNNSNNNTENSYKTTLNMYSGESRKGTVAIRKCINNNEFLDKDVVSIADYKLLCTITVKNEKSTTQKYSQVVQNFCNDLRDDFIDRINSKIEEVKNMKTVTELREFVGYNGLNGVSTDIDGQNNARTFEDVRKDVIAAYIIKAKQSQFQSVITDIEMDPIISRYVKIDQVKNTFATPLSVSNSDVIVIEFQVMQSPQLVSISFDAEVVFNNDTTLSFFREKLRRQLNNSLQLVQDQSDHNNTDLSIMEVDDLKFLNNEVYSRMISITMDVQSQPLVTLQCVDNSSTLLNFPCAIAGISEFHADLNNIKSKLRRFENREQSSITEHEKLFFAPGFNHVNIRSSPSVVESCNNSTNNMAGYATLNLPFADNQNGRNNNSCSNQVVFVRKDSYVSMEVRNLSAFDIELSLSTANESGGIHWVTNDYSEITLISKRFPLQLPRMAAVTMVFRVVVRFDKTAETNEEVSFAHASLEVERYVYHHLQWKLTTESGGNRIGTLMNSFTPRNGSEDVMLPEISKLAKMELKCVSESHKRPEGGCRAMFNLAKNNKLMHLKRFDKVSLNHYVLGNRNILKQLYANHPLRIESKVIIIKRSNTLQGHQNGLFSEGYRRSINNVDYFDEISNIEKETCDDFSISGQLSFQLTMDPSSEQSVHDTERRCDFELTFFESGQYEIFQCVRFIQMESNTPLNVSESTPSNKRANRLFVVTKNGIKQSSNVMESVKDSSTKSNENSIDELFSNWYINSETIKVVVK